MRKRRPLGLVVAGAGVVAIVVGVLGLVNDWGSTSSSVAASAATTTRPRATTTTELLQSPAAFLEDLAATFRSGDSAYLVSRLNPAVIARYGEAQCQTHVATLQDATAQFTVQQVGSPETYDYASDGKSTPVPGTLAVTAVRTADGAPVDTVVHITPVDGHFTWFTDCGDPI